MSTPVGFGSALYADVQERYAAEDETTSSHHREHVRVKPAGSLSSFRSMPLSRSMGDLSPLETKAVFAEREEGSSDEEDAIPRGLHRQATPPTGLGNDASAEGHLVQGIPARVALQKFKNLSLKGWLLGETPVDWQSPAQEVAVPKSDEQAANAGALECPSALGLRLTKRLTYDKQKAQRPPTAKRHLPGVPRLSTAVGSGESVLNLSDSKLGPRELFALAFTLPTHNSISTLLLSKNTIDDGCCELLVASLKFKPVITELDLSHNRIRSNGAAMLAGLFQIGGKENPNHFSPNMSHLSLRGNDIGNAGAISLVNEFFKRSCPLKNLDLASCGISDKGIQRIGMMLQSNRSLTALSLAWNTMGLRGAQSISEGLGCHPHLYSCNFSHLGMGEAGAAFIAAALAKNYSIHHMDMSNNNIRGGACAVFASSLETRGHMEFLDLSNNPLGQAGLHGASKPPRLVCAPPRLSNHPLPGWSWEVCCVRAPQVVLAGCNFNDLSSDAVNVVNECNPDGHYRLDLSNPVHFQQAADLAKLREVHGPSSWQNVTFNGKPFKLAPGVWDVPCDGELGLQFQSVGYREMSVKSLTDEEFDRMWSCTGASNASDEWKGSFSALLGNTVYLTAEQTAKVLRSFLWPGERLEAAMTLYGRITDPHNIHRVEACLTANTREKFAEALGHLRAFHPSNPTGQYSLNLSRKVDYCIAAQLLSYYAQEESQGLCKKEHLQKSWRNVMLNGKAIHQLDPHRWQLPKEGTLRLDYVSYDLPDSSTGAKYNVISDLRLLSLVSVLCEARGPPDPCTIVEYTKKYLHNHFMELWNVNFNRNKNAAERKLALKEARALMRSVQPPGRFKRSATLVKNLLGVSATTRRTALSQSSSLKEQHSSPRARRMSMPSMPSPEPPAAVEHVPSKPPRREEQTFTRRVHRLSVPSMSTSPTSPLTPRPDRSVSPAPSPLRKHRRSMPSLSSRAQEEIFEIAALASPATPRENLSPRAESLALKSVKASSGTSWQARGSPLKGEEDEEEEEDHEKALKIRDRKGALRALRVYSVNQYITTKHLCQLLEKFEGSDEDMTEVVVIFYQRVLDRARFPDVIKKLSKKAQGTIGQRLGPLNIFNSDLPDIHWLLRLSHPDELEACKRLLRIAVKDTGVDSVTNLYVNGSKMPRITEDESLYTVLSGHVKDGMIPTNVLEFDFEVSKFAVHCKAAKLIQQRFKMMKRNRLRKECKKAECKKAEWETPILK
ncbi:hypothetical protein CYMTET_3730 [Cymbomonas tetramitiformis]|uniref:DUF4476 domain-containing protein n=1 Tax=Cymbomonas tetramitiformis TaxID=36881 RepID=A0AAE0H2S9_9CHLO|nr:hypothetical protein CYMTET_3730 [Cymbomonas tetramitiformis]